MPPRSRPPRADDLLLQLGHAESLDEAAALLMSGRVVAIDPEGRERRVEKAGEALPLGTTFRVRGKDHPYVSRGGVKLEHALRHFAIEVSDRVAADVGVSTGGFTDCLLQAGARRVYAVDVGHNLTAWKIRTDPRVRLFERTHAGSLGPDSFGERVDLLVADLSFISLAKVVSALAAPIKPGGRALLLVKPQFELRPDEVPPGGVVADPALRALALDRALEAARDAGLTPLGSTSSPLPGRDGNLEWLALFGVPPGERSR